MKWSVTLVAEGDQVMSREQIVDLADAVAPSGGIASGIGTQRYGAQIIVEAEDEQTALERGRAEFTRAAAQAGLPPWPIVDSEAMSEDEDEAPDTYGEW